jgi:hypothetical protein
VTNSKKAPIFLISHTPANGLNRKKADIKFVRLIYAKWKGEKRACPAFQYPH